MIDIEKFRALALSFENAEENPHFSAPSFRINGKIFASLEIEKAKACLKLNVEDQTEFCTFDKAIYPVDNHWGKSGWTYINVNRIREELLIEILATAYKTVLKKIN